MDADALRREMDSLLLELAAKTKAVEELEQALRSGLATMKQCTRCPAGTICDEHLATHVLDRPEEKIHAILGMCRKEVVMVSKMVGYLNSQERKSKGSLLTH